MLCDGLLPFSLLQRYWICACFSHCYRQLFCCSWTQQSKLPFSPGSSKLLLQKADFYGFQKCDLSITAQWNICNMNMGNPNLLLLLHFLFMQISNRWMNDFVWLIHGFSKLGSFSLIHTSTSHPFAVILD